VFPSHHHALAGSRVDPGRNIDARGGPVLCGGAAANARACHRERMAAARADESRDQGLGRGGVARGAWLCCLGGVIGGGPGRARQERAGEPVGLCRGCCRWSRRRRNGFCERPARGRDVREQQGTASERRPSCGRRGAGQEPAREQERKPIAGTIPTAVSGGASTICNKQQPPTREGRGRGCPDSIPQTTGLFCG